MCLYPTLATNKKYTKTKKNGGIIPPIKDERVKKIPIGCGNCIECRNQKANNWRVRLLEDIKKHTNGKFITLTFNNESIAKINEMYIWENKEDKENRKLIEIKDLEGYEKDNAIATWAIRHFNERWRKKHKKAIRHWLITELGHQGTENIHLHGIVWTNESLDEVEKVWQYGYVWKGRKNRKGELTNYVNEQTVNYIIKYVSKTDEIHKTYKAIVLTSPGIGNNYTKDNRTNWQTNRYNEANTKETYRTRSGHKIGLPVYWRNKIYTEEQRELLWLQKLDKNERWVMGVKIDISRGEEEYFRALKYAQKENTKLGYGSNKKDWDRIQYELERREMNNNKRMQKVKEDWQKEYNNTNKDEQST